MSRAEKDNWFDTTSRYLTQLRTASQKHGDCPIVYAGDIFDKWNSSANLINFAIDCLPKGYAIPGQHDLPHHNYDDRIKSAYWTLVKAGALKNIKPGRPSREGNLMLHGFPWGFQIKPINQKIKDQIEDGNPCIHLAVVHSYIWTNPNNSYPGAPKEKLRKNYDENLKGYNAALFGDNHKGFMTETIDQVRILNNGGFMRRKSDEKDYQTCYGLLYSDGTITRVPLEGKDKWEEVDEVKGEMSSELEDFTEFISNMENVVIDFGEAVRRYLNDKKVSPQVRKLVMKALEGK